MRGKEEVGKPALTGSFPNAIPHMRAGEWLLYDAASCRGYGSRFAFIWSRVQIPEGLVICKF